MDQPAGQTGQLPKTHQHRTIMGVLAYLGILIIIPFLVAKDDQFVKFHLKQGLLLFIVEVVIWFLMYSYVYWMFWPLFQLLNLVVLVYIILGIVNVLNGKEQELPLIGSLARNFKF